MRIAYRFLAAFVLGCVLTTSISAKTFLVGVTSDIPDFNSADGICSWKQQTDPIDPIAYCSLRAAIMQANATIGKDTIQLHAGKTYELGLPIVGLDTPSTGDLDITSPLRIETLEPWPAAPATIDANGIDRVFEINLLSVNDEVDLVDLILTGGSPILETGTGIINSRGTIRLNHSELLNNAGSEGQEAVLACMGNDAQSRVFLTDSTLHSNMGTAIDCSATIIRTAIFNNSLYGVFDGSYISISNSTISNNLVGVVGTYDADVSIKNSSLVGNYRGLSLDSTVSATILNSVFSGNGNSCYKQKPNQFIAINNLYDDDSCFPIGPDDFNRFNTPARLSKLGYHGGPTPTHRPHIDSAVIDKAVYCMSDDGVDQRGWPRPADFTHQSPARCDIGAFELEPDVIFWEDFERLL